MTVTTDAHGKTLRLPDDLRVCECHQCGRLSVRRKLSAHHSDVVKPLIARGLMGRLVAAPGRRRPTCARCHNLLRLLEACA